MANLPVGGAFVSYTPQQWFGSRLVVRSSTEGNEGTVKSEDIVQGRIFWLCSKEELPDRAVRRAHGKGAIEEGIYSHPVVILARPADEDHLVHFHLITSLQGKKLDQLYNKSTEFHASRRSWYLPISPTPEHPDATSKKTKKRFPTLDLAHGTRLRWDSYVNIRHVYKIDWSLLKPYSNPDNLDMPKYQFDRDSTVKLLAKSKFLTMYEPGPQREAGQALKRSVTEPIRVTTEISQTVEHDSRHGRSPSLDEVSETFAKPSVTPSPHRSDFGRRCVGLDRISNTLPKVPPDGRVRPVSVTLISKVLKESFDSFGEHLQNMAIRSEAKTTSVFLGSTDQFWRDAKGVTAVAIASI